jgi:predicted transposase YbfD/YdcC
MMYEFKSEDVVSILEYFKDLEDPRSTINRKHLLGDLIVISVLGVVAGADGPKAIGVWAQSNADWLKQYLQLPQGIPSHDTIGRLLATLKPAAFQNCFQQWLATLPSQAGVDQELLDETIAMDGKALRRSHDRRHGVGALFLVSAWSVQRGISLGQLATEEKSNEITAIPQLLDVVEVTNAIVTIDAAGCQVEIARKIVDGGGDYVLSLKGNQGTLHESVKSHFTTWGEEDFADANVRCHRTVVTGHGRIDTLIYYQAKAPETLAGKSRWKNLRTIGMVIRISERNGKTTTETRYFISSLRLGVRRFAASVRGHWAIENTLHWCLDVTFREDESRVRDRIASDNLAWLRRFALSLLKQQTDSESIAMRRRMAGWNNQYLAQVLGISTT